MNTIKIGVAGLGRIGWKFHAKGLATHPDYTLSAVADMEAGRRAQAEAELGCRAYASYDEMIEKAGLDAVVIATPTHFHRDMALKAFAKRLHVILEKPMAMNLAEAREIVRAASEADRRLTVYQPHRLSANNQQLQALIRSGVIGRLFWVRRAIFGYVRRNDWQSLSKFGGGMLNNYGAHGIDQILGLIGFTVGRLFCSRQRVASLGDAEDVVKVVMESPEGVMGEVEINMASVLSPYSILVWGTKGGIIVTGERDHGEFEVRRFDPAALPPKEVNEGLASVNREYPSDTLDIRTEKIPVDPAQGINLFTDFACSIRTGRPPAVKPEETLAVMEVLERCRNESGNIRALASV